MGWFQRGILPYIVVFLLAAIFLAVPAYFIYTNARGLVTGQVGKNAIDIAISVAAFVEKDIDNFNDIPVYVYAPDAEGGTAFDPPIGMSPETAGPQTNTEEAANNNAGADYSSDSAGDDGSGSDDAAYDDSVYDDEYWYDEGAYDEGWYDDEYWYDEGAYDEGWYDDEYWNDDSAYDGAMYDDGEYSDYRSRGPTSTSGSLAPDAENNGQAPRGPSFNEEYLKEITLLLDRIGAETGAAQVSITKKVSDTRKGYVMHPDNVDEGARSSELTEEEILAFRNGTQSLSNVLSDTAKGEYLKGHAPIFDPDTGAAVGVVVVEFLLADAVGLMSGVSLIILASFALILLLTSLVVNRLIGSRAKYLYTDYLTGLCNKRCFENRLNKAVRRAKPGKSPLSLVMIDIDRFKTINDTCGHAVGDDVIKGVAAVLKRYTRSTDFCCRFGGDEFTLILPHTTGAHAVAIAERIREEAARLTFSAAGNTFGVTLSIGVAEATSGAKAEALLALADRTMYHSKNNGKNKTTVYNWA